jgi:uncharacterized membrane protein
MVVCSVEEHITMAQTLTPSRMEAFSDGVIAVIITIMVLDLKVPTLLDQPNHLIAIRAELPQLLVYLLSFIQIGICWVNHHYLVDDLDHVSHGVLWANLAFLFCLSLIPLGTEWVGTRGVQPIPVAIYSSTFVIASIAWLVLASTICSRSGIRPAAGPLKQGLSAIINVASIAVAFRSPWAALAMIAAIAIWWLLPPRRILEQTRTHPR